MTALLEVYAGQPVIVTFRVTASGVPMDPATAIIKYQDVAGLASLTTLALGDLTNIDDGTYTLTLDTTSFVGGPWDVQILGTDPDGVGVVQFQIFPRPLG